jgi:hypothetical protein
VRENAPTTERVVVMNALTARANERPVEELTH